MTGLRSPVLVLLLEGVSIGSVATTTPLYTPKNGFVPDEATAVRVAEAVLTPIYGETQIASERPFSAQLKGDVWIVSGHLPNAFGGVAEIRISKRTCQVISVSHGK